MLKKPIQCYFLYMEPFLKFTVLVSNVEVFMFTYFAHH